MGDDDEYSRLLKIQRKSFESQFGSLDSLGYKDKTRDGESRASSNGDEVDGGGSDRESRDLGSSSGSENEMELDFSGFGSSENEEEEEEEEIDKEERFRLAQPKVVRLNQNFSTTSPMISKRDKKLLKAGKVLTYHEAEKLEKLRNQRSKAAKNDREEQDNLENDLKLQRLLQESHILSRNLDYSGTDVTLQTMDWEAPTGHARKRTLDSRLQAASAVNSSTGGLPKTLEKMPMSMRRGMISSHQRKVAKHEQEAKNAGIILSKVKKGEYRDINQGKGFFAINNRLGLSNSNKKGSKTRERGLKINSVGKSTRNGLVISQQEIDKINRKRFKSNRKK